MNARQERIEKDAERSHEIELLKLQMERGDRKTENELAIARSEGSWRGLKASYRSDIDARLVSTWVNNIRSLFRPLLTILLWAAALIVFFAVTGGRLEKWIIQAGEFGDIIRYMIFSMYFSASTATVWWFGDRAMTPPGMKAR
jgi:hypothetical protein